MIFRKSTHPDTEPPIEGLPAGYSDPEGNLFVPEDLRDAYRQTKAPRFQEAAQMMSDLVRRAATAAAIEKIGDGNDLSTYDRADHWTRLSELRRELMPGIEQERAGELLDVAHHWLRLEEARKIKLRADENAKSEAYRQTQYTCPVCLDYNPGRNGAVQRRSLMPGRTPTWFGNPNVHPVLNSCEICWVVASSDYIESLAAETPDRFAQGTTPENGPVTRRWLVTTTLDDQAFAAASDALTDN